MEESYLRDLYDELDVLEEMTEAEACRHYKVDYKAEAIRYIIDWWWHEIPQGNYTYEDYINKINHEKN
jgi:hypothetical protein